MEKIKFQLEDGTEAEFYVEEQTRIGGVAYLLVSDSQDDEATAYIFKDVSEDDSQEACYEMVEDEDEMQMPEMDEDIIFRWSAMHRILMNSVRMYLSQARCSISHRIPDVQWVNTL